MKNILMIMLMSFVTLTFGQYDTPNCPRPFDPTPYVGLGISMTNSDEFAVTSYPSIEVGFMFENITCAGVFGRSNLDHMFQNDSFDNYWYEGKIAYSFPLDVVNVYGIFGVGNYINTKHLFIEYGAGISKNFTRNFGGCLQVSNWDGITYLSPSVFLSF